MSEPKETPHNYPEHSEMFEVVLLKNGVSDLVALPGDFKRVQVQASAPFHALTHDDVAAVQGFHPLFATAPGVASQPEIMARRRELEGPTVDRSKI